MAARIRTRHGVGQDLLKGAIAGAVATFVMGKVTGYMYEHEDRDARRKEDDASGGRSAYEAAAERAVRRPEPPSTGAAGSSTAPPFTGASASAPGRSTLSSAGDFRRWGPPVALHSAPLSGPSSTRDWCPRSV